jgi:hypothetical protein
MSVLNKDQVIKSDWFTKFHIGNDAPGVRHFRDEVEEHLWETKKDAASALGWTADNVTYHFNDMGYRGGISPGHGVPAGFGCSCTFGTGVDERHHWPGLMGIANCGQPGSSNDKIARLAVSYINTYKPREIFICWTYPQRREWVDEFGNVIGFKNVTAAEAAGMMAQKFVSWDNAHLYLQNELWDEYNYTKNVLFVESYCTANDVNLYYTSMLEQDHTRYPYSRDLNHPGPEWHVNVAALFQDLSYGN